MTEQTTHEATALQPLWTNTMIYQWSEAASEKVLHKNRIRTMISSAQAEGLAETMRDEYEAERADLRAQLAQKQAELDEAIASLQAIADFQGMMGMDA